MKCGIYEILNIKNNKKYIGSSFDINIRWIIHRSLLKGGIHDNNHLQRSYNKYGIDNFVYNIIEECLEEDLFNREQYWMDQYPYEMLYNQRPSAKSNKGFKHSLDTRKRMSDYHKVNSNSGRFKLTIPYKFMSPEGILYEGIGPSKFARELKLDKACVFRLLKGEFKQHKGWTVAA